MVKQQQVIDLDVLLGMINKDEVPTKEVKLLGRSWTVQCDLNSFAMAQIAGGDASGLSKFIAGLVIDEQRDDFIELLSAAKGLDGEKLGQLLTKLIEVAGERPTEPPSPSPSTGKSRTSTLKSVGN